MSKSAFLPTSDLSETQLLKHIQAGHLTAFWELWLRHQSYLSSRCLHWTGGNTSDAEDILSQAMCRAWEQIPRYAASLENPKAWLIKLTHNLCVNQQLKRRRQAITLGNLDHSTSEVQSLPGMTSPESPEYALLKRESRTYLHKLIQTLSPQLRDPLLLYYYRGLSCDTIAQQLRISLPTVYKRLQLARDILRPQVQKYFEGSRHLSTVPITPKADQEMFSPLPPSIPHLIPDSPEQTDEQIDPTLIATCVIYRFPGSCK